MPHSESPADNPFNAGDVREALGFDRNDPNVKVHFIPMGGYAEPNPLDFNMGDEADAGIDTATGMFGVRDSKPGYREGNAARIPDYESIVQVLDQVGIEVVRARMKHPPYNSPHEGHSVMREELDVELWEHVCKDTGRSLAARAEAIQVAATAVLYVLDLIDNPSKPAAPPVD